MSEPAGALITVEGEQIALRGVDIRARVRDSASRVTVKQHYVNTEKVPVEAVYSFPLEESGAVCEFEVEIGGRTIVGQVEEKEAAFEKYDEAMAEGHGAFLLDQDRPNIFTASVGNLAPGQEATVKIGYVAELDRSGERMRLMIPTTISPRYVPPEMEAEGDPSDLDHIAPPVIIGDTPYGLTLRVEIETAGKIKSVQSPSHPIAVELTENGATVELSHEKTSLDQDFVLTVEKAQPYEPSVCLAKDGDDRSVCMIDFFPDFSDSQAGSQEVIFVLDCSGSMYGESIAQAKAALLLCLRSLEEGDSFNIFVFGSSYNTLFKKPAEYNQKNLDKASEWVEKIDANLGGTEIMRPLKAALSGSSKLPRSIFLLTDGEVGNEKEVIDMAAKKAGGSRIFTFGIGRGASEYLVRGLARAASGASEFIFPGERIQPKVLKQLGRARTPYFEEIAVDWGDLEPDFVAPYRIPALFKGDALTVYGRFEKVVESTIALKAKSEGKTREWAMKVSPGNLVEENAVPVLFARKAIRDLEEGSSKLHKKGSRQKRRKEGKVEEAMLELSKRYGLLSSVASMVAIEKRTDPLTEEAQLRRVPVALTRGWGGVFSAAMDRAILSTAAPQAAPAMAFARKSKRRRLDAPLELSMEAEFLEEPKASAPAPVDATFKEEMDDSFDMCLSEPAPEYSEPSASKALEDSADRLLMDLTSLQRFDGSWPLNQNLADAAQAELSALQKAAAELAAENAIEREEAESIVATLVAMHTLKDGLADLEDEWALLYAKAEKWIGARSIKAPSRKGSLMEWAKQLLG